ncbi:MAG TPA: hypothetical protein VK280_14550 [Streptosporangiaceae bacterium]|nr:hypothetical protein [Streptosporangiaceae bacterium]
MSIKSKVLAAAATLTLVSGVGAAGALTAGTASAATPSCGPSCINLFSHQFGNFASPNYTVDVLRQGEKTGQPIILFRQANFDPALDWTVAFQGLTSDFFAAGLVSSAVALHYGCIPGTAAFPTCIAAVNDPAFENEYSPFGVESGLCMGVAATAFSDEGVTLQPCGVSSKTVWILDTYDQQFNFISALRNGVPLINGSDTNFSQPFVLSYPNQGFPTDKPRPQLVVLNLTGFSNGISGPQVGTISSNQLWGARFGVLP